MKVAASNEADNVDVKSSRELNFPREEFLTVFQTSRFYCRESFAGFRNLARTPSATWSEFRYAPRVPLRAISVPDDSPDGFGAGAPDCAFFLNAHCESLAS